ncbi:Flp pilus assembly protein TadB [Pseudomonas migulae]|uniref:hypothetical protein n=1 Tax=Pseudomonas migulae TaxID=78543 RepID=UPI00209CCDBB|nr:hypothetical protein [Pseudomonas migulae]MCP1519640.1 Flp pilus assembly protein TadB [Pseudomonas migulae]
MFATYLHNKLVRLEFLVVVMPASFAFGALGLYTMLSAGLLGVIIVLVMVVPSFIAGVCLTHMYLCFEDEAERCILAPLLVVAYIWLLLAVFYQDGLGLPNRYENWFVWLLGVWGLAIVGVHWLCLFCCRFELPRRNQRLKKLPDRI